MQTVPIESESVNQTSAVAGSLQADPDQLMLCLSGVDVQIDPCPGSFNR